MCGIVGYIGSGQALTAVMEGLEKLEYRGYDSAGVALLKNGQLEVYRAEGKLAALKELLAKRVKNDSYDVGIGHTRWATHGRPSETNAHPHTAGRISVIHNGIIENYQELRKDLLGRGCVFESETDTEIIAHLLNQFVEAGKDSFSALRATCDLLQGSYAFLALDRERADRILVAKQATPLVIGSIGSSVLIASDFPAILSRTREVIFMEDGDIAEVSPGKIDIVNQGEPVSRETQTILWDPETAERGGFPHFMLKEIYDQVRVTADTIRGRIDKVQDQVVIADLGISLAKLAAFNRVQLVACGTAWHACLIARYYIEAYAGIPCDVEYASEFRYRQQLCDEQTLVLAVSQSGETLDTLAALEHVGEQSTKIAVCNVLGSSITRKVDHVLYIHAGPEISVASTKAFTTQIVSLFLLARLMGQANQRNSGVLTGLLHDLTRLPAAIHEGLKRTESVVRDLAKELKDARDFLFIGRGICYPIALEGALKLKEISYIHAEGYAAGELKHGPIALVDSDLPVVVVLQREQPHFDKTLSNLREVEARQGRIIAVTDAASVDSVKSFCLEVVQVPYISDALSPILLNIPLQLLAYYMAVEKGTDVDLPRNLAKSVTVE